LDVRKAIEKPKMSREDPNISKSEYIQKILQVGKKGFCTSEDLVYFLPGFPDHHKPYLEFRIKPQDVPPDLLPDLIRGCHLIEEKSVWGFGSPTPTKELIDALEVIDPDQAIALYNWVAAHGGNYYINSGISYAQNQQRKLEHQQEIEAIRMSEQKRHEDAVARKKQNQGKHEASSAQTNNQYQEFKARFQAMDDAQLIDAFNREVGNSGWTGSRANYLVALHEELENRDFDYSSIGNKKHLSFAKKIRLESKKIILVEPTDGGGENE
jgi:hypothetical protein